MQTPKHPAESRSHGNVLRALLADKQHVPNCLGGLGSDRVTWLATDMSVRRATSEHLDLGSLVTNG